MSTKRLFVSDVHSSAGWGLVQESGKHSWEWFTEDDCNRFVSFINWYD